MLRSDAYALSRVPTSSRSAARGALPYVELDPASTGCSTTSSAASRRGRRRCATRERLIVRGDVTFGAGVVVRGTVALDEDAPTQIKPGAVLES